MKSASDPKNRAIVEIKKQEGEAVAISIIVKALESVANYFNIGKNLDAKQILDIAALTASEYFYLTENELQLLVNRIKLNKYAEKIKVLDSMDGRIWFAYLAEFQAERLSERKKIEDEERRARQIEWEEARKLDPPKPETIAKVKELVESFKIKAAKGITPTPTGLPKYEFEQEEKQFFAKVKEEFEDLFPQDGKEVRGMRFVLYGGAMLNFEAYAKQRFKEINE